ncbi:hypothetical protein BDR22DRAFT_358469 [Usnea florida]
MARFGHSTTGAEVVEQFKEWVKGKTILVTGPSVGGIGAETAMSLAAGSPACIILAGRSLPKIQPLIDRISGAYPAVETQFVSLDLSSLRAIRDAAADIDQRVKSIDILINNAAIMACPFAKTVDGIESQFGTNYVGHFLLTNLIMNRCIAGQGARIVNVSSSAHQMADVELDDWNFEDGSKYKPWVAYGRAKTANILFTVALSSKLRTRYVSSVSLHPGSIKTNLQVHLTPEGREEAIKAVETNTGHPFSPRELKTIEQGCSTTLVAALDPSILSGSYLEDCVVAEPAYYTRDQEKAELLWATTEKLVGQKFQWSLDERA